MISNVCATVKYTVNSIHGTNEFFLAECAFGIVSRSSPTLAILYYRSQILSVPNAAWEFGKSLLSELPESLGPPFPLSAVPRSRPCSVRINLP